MTEESAVRELTREECDALLVRNHVGRIAFSHRDRVDIEPISYVYAEGWIYGRTSHGSKLRTLAHNRWVAFETDEVQAMYLWRSVVVKGALYLLEKSGASSGAWAAAVALLRPVMPELLEPDDPSPERTELFRIHADGVTGRSTGRAQ